MVSPQPAVCQPSVQASPPRAPFGGLWGYRQSSGSSGHSGQETPAHLVGMTQMRAPAGPPAGSLRTLNFVTFQFFVDRGSGGKGSKD